MLNKDIFNKFDKLVKKYELDDALLNDLASAICTADMLFGTNEKQLDINRFVASTGGRFSGVGVVVPKQPLPDVQVLRVLCDILILGIGSKDSKVVSDITLTIPSSVVVADKLGIRKQKVPYKNEDECLKILDTLYNSCSKDDLVVIVELIKDLSNKSNDYMSFKNSKSVDSEVKDLLLPLSIRYELRAYHTDTMDFVEDSTFFKFLSRHGYSIDDYCSYIKMYYITATMQNIVLKLEHLVNHNKPLFCTVCVELQKVLKENGVNSFCCNNVYNLSVITNGNCLKIKLYREYMSKLINKTGMIGVDEFDTQIDLARQLTEIMKRWCK